MFGYIRINKPEMKVKEYELYRGIYCSLCRALGEHYGIFSRLILSYDLTFLALLRLATDKKLLNFKNSFCPFNPTKKCNYCTNADDQLKFAASMTIIMFYHKVKDNIKDRKGLKKLLMFLIYPYASLKYKKAKKLYPDLAQEISSAMDKQNEFENTVSDSIDRAAHQSADALGKILAFEQAEKSNDLYRFGYLIGKWVYLMDAADDIESDIKNKSYNVFVNKYNLNSKDNYNDQIKEEVELQLNMNLGMAVEAYENLDETPLAPIINNILIDGMYMTMKMILKGNKKQ